MACDPLSAGDETPIGSNRQSEWIRYGKLDGNAQLILWRQQRRESGHRCTDKAEGFSSLYE